MMWARPLMGIDVMKKSIALIFCICCAFSTTATNAAEYPLKPYDATYDRASALGRSTYRMCTDGKGHMRIDTTTPGSDRKMIMIMDYPKKESIMLLEQQKLAMVMPLQSDSTTQAPIDETKMKSLGGRSLGTKVIDGHPCHGYEFDKNGIKQQSWTGDDTGCMVYSETVQPNGKEVMRLAKYAAASPAAEAFAVPTGYTRQKMPTMPGAR